VTEPPNQKGRERPAEGISRTPQMKQHSSGGSQTEGGLS
jgi:hypothetical protein